MPENVIGLDDGKIRNKTHFQCFAIAYTILTNDLRIPLHLSN